MDQTTNWIIKLREIVSAPLRKVTQMAAGAQKKIVSVATANGNLAKSSAVMGREFKKNLEGLNAQLRTLESLQSKAYSTKHIQNYQKAINATKEQIAKLNAAKIIPEAPVSWFTKFKGQLKEAASQSPLGGAFQMIANPKVLALTAGIGLTISGMGKAVNLSKDFQYGLAKINATGQLADNTLSQLKGRLLDIGGESGGNFDRITDAYEKILSQTGKVNLSLDITETAVKGAKAGFTDIDLVASALAQTLSVVGEQNTTANEVMDTLLKAKKVGAGEFKDFAQYLPQLIAAGHNLGVTFKDTAGLFAYMTAKGQTATDSAMLMQNAFTALQKKDLIIGMEKKGLSLFNKDGSRKNIESVFLDLNKKMANMTDKQKTKFLIDISLNDAQARNAFSVLTSDAGKFKEIMGQVNNSLGETDKQLNATLNTTRDWGDVMDSLKVIGVGIGDVLLPIVDTLVNGLVSVGRGFKELFKGTVFQKSSWRDQTDDEIKKAARVKNASLIAEQRTREHYKLAPDENFKSRAQFAFFDSIYKQNLGKEKKNKIDSNEKEEKSAKQQAAGKLLGAVDNTQFGKKSRSTDGEGGGSGNKSPRTLIQNLYITNHVKTEKEADKMKRKLTDDIVDAARDGMVQIGA